MERVENEMESYPTCCSCGFTGQIEDTTDFVACYTCEVYSHKKCVEQKTAEWKCNICSSFAGVIECDPNLLEGTNVRDTLSYDHIDKSFKEHGIQPGNLAVINRDSVTQKLTLLHGFHRVARQKKENKKVRAEVYEDLDEHEKFFLQRKANKAADFHIKVSPIATVRSFKDFYENLLPSIEENIPKIALDKLLFKSEKNPLPSKSIRNTSNFRAICTSLTEPLINFMLEIENKNQVDTGCSQKNSILFSQRNLTSMSTICGHYNEASSLYNDLLNLHSHGALNNLKVTTLVKNKLKDLKEKKKNEKIRKNNEKKRKEKELKNEQKEQKGTDNISNLSRGTRSRPRNNNNSKIRKGGRSISLSSQLKTKNNNNNNKNNNNKAKIRKGTRSISNPSQLNIKNNNNNKDNNKNDKFFDLTETELNSPPIKRRKIIKRKNKKQNIQNPSPFLSFQIKNKKLITSDLDFSLEDSKKESDWIFTFAIREPILELEKNTLFFVDYNKKRQYMQIPALAKAPSSLLPLSTNFIMEVFWINCEDSNLENNVFASKPDVYDSSIYIFYSLLLSLPPIPHIVLLPYAGNDNLMKEICLSLVTAIAFMDITLSIPNFRNKTISLQNFHPCLFPSSPSYKFCQRPKTNIFNDNTYHREESKIKFEEKTKMFINENKEVHKTECFFISFINKHVGFGVKTKVDLNADTPLFPYYGLVSFNHQEGNDYLLKVDEETFIDGRNYGGIASLMNHSHEPNCVFENKSINGVRGVWINTIKEIKRGEELTIDYNWTSSTNYTRCHCGTDSCTTFIEKIIVEKEKTLTEIFKKGFLLKLAGTGTRKYEQHIDPYEMTEFWFSSLLEMFLQIRSYSKIHHQVAASVDDLKITEANVNAFVLIKEYETVIHSTLIILVSSHAVTALSDSVYVIPCCSTCSLQRLVPIEDIKWLINDANINRAIIQNASTVDIDNCVESSMITFLHFLYLYKAHRCSLTDLIKTSFTSSMVKQIKNIIFKQRSQILSKSKVSKFGMKHVEIFTASVASPGMDILREINNHDKYFPNLKRTTTTGIGYVGGYGYGRQYFKGLHGQSYGYYTSKKQDSNYHQHLLTLERYILFMWQNFQSMKPSLANHMETVFNTLKVNKLGDVPTTSFYISKNMTNTLHTDDDVTVTFGIWWEVHEEGCKGCSKTWSFNFPEENLSIVLEHGVVIIWDSVKPHYTFLKTTSKCSFIGTVIVITKGVFDRINLFNKLNKK